MKLHEYQAKDLFRKYGIPVLNGGVAVSYTHLTLPTSDLV